MLAMTKPLILLALLVCAGCAKSSDISEPRRDHILAGPHGWIDLTVHAPAAASAPASASAAASGVPVICAVDFSVDGETMTAGAYDLAHADAAGNPIGFRFPVPAGALKTQLVFNVCVGRESLKARLDVAQQKDQLTTLEFDGKTLALKAMQPYSPATLDTVHGDVGKLHDHGEATDGTLANLTRLVFASVILNLVVLGVLFLRRRR